MQPITKAADLLNISEYRLFSEAYFTWFGDRANENDITFVFSQFKMFGEVPEWADLYARHVLVDLEANRPSSARPRKTSILGRLRGARAQAKLTRPVTNTVACIQVAGPKPVV